MTDRRTIRYKPAARRALAGELPEEVVAADELITGASAGRPHRVGKPSEERCEGLYSARRGTCRISCSVSGEKPAADIHSIRHRRDACRY
ncbi:type II toxin-antitoxin system RelE/ParE family toxin [Streptomyces sp. MUM 203J]|uniref:type II toxin-antitoxin system RelE family toxin n=1 Tax=Streptomyces sp. MUM 203J TaxID=2791990 RepID=UPI001F04312B|nr:hypothetical protein [Streptomyces sp. MUM 203J]MCH0539411.1 type II toxin-antitoxin system RelE/ParE family toxin [Streptomyces sp. MUM 203J]